MGLPEPGPAVRVVLHVVAAGVSGLLVGEAMQALASDQHARWILGRATGIAALLILTTLTVSGLVLAHPRRARLRGMLPASRIRGHVSLAVFCLALLVIHIFVLATDEYAKVGWWGALLPMASQFRPVPVTLGVVAAYSGLASGLTAALAGRLTGRLWWPVHKFAAAALVLTWLHGLLAGSDTRQLLPLYLGCALVTGAVAVSRYTARTPADQVQELIESIHPTTRPTSEKELYR